MSENNFTTVQCTPSRSFQSGRGDADLASRECLKIYPGEAVGGFESAKAIEAVGTCMLARDLLYHHLGLPCVRPVPMSSEPMLSQQDFLNC